MLMNSHLLHCIPSLRSLLDRLLKCLGKNSNISARHFTNYVEINTLFHYIFFFFLKRDFLQHSQLCRELEIPDLKETCSVGIKYKMQLDIRIHAYLQHESQLLEQPKTSRYGVKGSYCPSTMAKHTYAEKTFMPTSETYNAN